MKSGRMLAMGLTLVLSMGIAAMANAQLPSKEKNADSSAVGGATPVNESNFVRAESDHMFRSKKIILDG
mgnify:CR=1 FL=1